ncbi:MAG TPA: type I methionyl aminopeptidase [Thermoanaerobaculia bacterium]|nr:type I methionyl aminopeptidase [Thermoanaerobaculia bacterium]HUM30660.1 type I methionyl aminopeptidase [Thermoanaerobaculia bacterium]HXK68932.1 type I methionyl aminopeptidase [Thermoanaerobaculia bacterium]
MSLAPKPFDRAIMKSAREIEILDEANGYVHRLLSQLAAMAEPGMTTMDLEQVAERYCKTEEVTPAFKGYSGFPACLCLSINDEIVHGIPSAHRVLRDGDILSIDFGVYHRGYFGDAALTVPLGKVSSRARHLMDGTLKSLKTAVDSCVVGNTLGDIGYAVQSTVEPMGYSVVRDFVGHGIGLNLHEPPQVPNFGRRGHGMPLTEGLVLAIEPMVCEGDYRVKVDEDGWTARTFDGKLSAHFEYSVAVTNGNPRVLGRPGF